MSWFLTHELATKRHDLATLCREYGVARLDIFGSAVTDEWRPGESDLDFVVVFRPDPHRSLANRYLGVAEKLEALFHCSVDLLTEQSIRNPYFRQSVNETRTPVYVE